MLKHKCYLAVRGICIRAHGEHNRFPNQEEIGQDVM